MKISKTAYLIIFFANIFVFTNTLVSAQCQGDFSGLIDKCAKFVQKPGPKVNPDQACCDVIKSVDIACVCAHIPPEAENIISMDKAASVAAACGKPLKSGTRCGSYIVPLRAQDRRHI